MRPFLRIDFPHKAYWHLCGGRMNHDARRNTVTRIMRFKCPCYVLLIAQVERNDIDINMLKFLFAFFFIAYQKRYAVTLSNISIANCRTNRTCCTRNNSGFHDTTLPMSGWKQCWFRLGKYYNATAACRRSEE